MNTFLLVLTLIVNGNTETFTIDYNLTKEDCNSRVSYIKKISPHMKVTCIKEDDNINTL